MLHRPSSRPGNPLTRAVGGVYDWSLRRPGVALGLYWALAFVTTHIPPLRPPNPDAPPPPPFDKLVHAALFAGLAWLLMNLLTRRLRPWAAAVIVLLIAAAYGAVDERTQPFFRRSTDLWDWVADMVGAFLGLGIFAVTAKRNSKLQGASSNE